MLERADEPGRAVFLYDFNSPYAYLAATRVDDVLPEPARWQPVAFAFILRAHARTPWSFDEHERPLGMAECERRARRYGLPEMRWPPGWPVHSYGLTALRAALVADQVGLLAPFSRAAFARNFVQGTGLTELADVLAVAASVGLDPDLVRQAVGTEAIKRALAQATDAAIEAGVVGVPTVLAAGQAFWGDDRLPAAAEALHHQHT